MNTAEYLDAIGQKLDLKTDGQIARELGIDRQRVSHYRRQVRSFSDRDLIDRIAEILELDSEFIALEMAAQREKDPRMAVLWRRAAQRLGSSAAAVLLAVVTLLPYHADANENNRLQGSTSEHCILC